MGNIGRLLKQADTVVNAGDADREGQLLIDEILQYFKYKRESASNLSDGHERRAIRKALVEMKPTKNIKPFSLSGGTPARRLAARHKHDEALHRDDSKRARHSAQRRARSDAYSGACRRKG